MPSRAMACMMREEPNIEPSAVERHAAAMPRTTIPPETAECCRKVRAVICMYNSPRDYANRDLGDIISARLHDVEVVLQRAAVHRPRLSKDQKDVTNESGGDGTDRAERDRAAGVGEVAGEVGALHHS